MNRKEAISQLADMIADIYLDYPVRVGIDGFAASGKTMLADELIEPLQSRGRSVIRVSVDGFHNPSEIRRQQGYSSPQGYYDDSFNHNAIVSNVLVPLGPGGNLNYSPAVFDFRTDSEVSAPFQRASQNSILLFEGVFLHRPELKKYWDFSIFVHADFDISLKRAKKRDLNLFKTAEKVHEKFTERFIPGHKIYLSAESPEKSANVIWDNNNIENPTLTTNKPAGKTSPFNFDIQ
jgi:uridine kinase